jgi:hypothetical protein
MQPPLRFSHPPSNKSRAADTTTPPPHHQPPPQPPPQTDGKVCLSLLGTFHGSSAAEKWNPKDSSLFQILLSVQGLILIEVGGRRSGGSSLLSSPQPTSTHPNHLSQPTSTNRPTNRNSHPSINPHQDPYFNEPSHEVMRGKTEGTASSTHYNAEVGLLEGWGGGSRRVREAEHPAESPHPNPKPHPSHPAPATNQVRLATLRWSMLAHLKKPPPGFETVVREHFR